MTTAGPSSLRALPHSQSLLCSHLHDNDRNISWTGVEDKEPSLCNLRLCYSGRAGLGAGAKLRWAEPWGVHLQGCQGAESAPLMEWGHVWLRQRPHRGHRRSGKVGTPEHLNLALLPSRGGETPSSEVVTLTEVCRLRLIGVRWYCCRGSACECGSLLANSLVQGPGPRQASSFMGGTRP